MCCSNSVHVCPLRSFSSDPQKQKCKVAAWNLSCFSNSPTKQWLRCVTGVFLGLLNNSILLQTVSVCACTHVPSLCVWKQWRETGREGRFCYLDVFFSERVNILQIILFVFNSLSSGKHICDFLLNSHYPDDNTYQARDVFTLLSFFFFFGFGD